MADPLLQQNITDSLDWEDAEKFRYIEGCLRALAERAIEYNVEAFALLTVDRIEKIMKTAKHYTGSLPIIIGQTRYLCFYRLKADQEAET